MENENGQEENNKNGDVSQGQEGKSDDGTLPLNAQENKSAKSQIELDLEKAKAEAAQWKNDFLYLKADFENYKRNAIKERSDLLKYGSERVLVEILEAVDNFERALKVDLTEQTFPNFRKGIELIHSEIMAVLSRFGLKEVPSEGQPFDPNLHEALSSEDAPDVPSGHVSRVFRKPYRLHDKLIRPGQVVVAK